MTTRTLKPPFFATLFAVPYPLLFVLAALASWAALYGLHLPVMVVEITTAMFVASILHAKSRHKVFLVLEGLLLLSLGLFFFCFPSAMPGIAIGERIVHWLAVATVCLGAADTIRFAVAGLCDGSSFAEPKIRDWAATTVQAARRFGPTERQELTNQAAMVVCVWIGYDLAVRAMFRFHPTVVHALEVFKHGFGVV
jgi:hypothetical protein